VDGGLYQAGQFALIFYASLSDEQKAKFNAIGPPPKATSSPQQRQSGGQQ
jgi:hypothetical protein